MPRIGVAPRVRDATYYGNALSAFFVICVTVANYDLVTLRAQAALTREKARSEEMAALLRTMFGRYLAPEMMASLLENPAALELGGQKRSVTIMLTDLRGFTALAERLPPDQVVRMLNGYFEVMLGVVERYRHVNEIIGDGLLVLFGAPQDMPDRVERAVACAIEMQNAMCLVNERNRAERIESFTVGGEVLVSESVRRALGASLRIDGQREVMPKGAEAPLRIYEVGGIAGRFNVALETATPRAAFADLKLNLAAAGEVLGARDFYGKALAAGSTTLVRFTAVPPEVDAYFEALRRRASS